MTGPQNQNINANAQGTLTRRIVDEVELSPEALSAQRADRPSRDEIIAAARERIAVGFYDQPGVLDATIQRLASDLTA